MLLYAFLPVLGMLLIALGFWGAYRCPKPYDAVVPWCAPVGLLVVLVGTILLFIPHFFG